MLGTTWDLELAETLVAVNAARAASGPRDDPLEREVEQRFAASRRLAVYGSLAPGEANHHLIADLPGTWEEGVVTGMLRTRDTDPATAFPVLQWRAGGPPVPASLFVSDALPQHWARLDAFEGESYRRILVPVQSGDGALIAVANAYADATDD
jgi:gamma-glutamylcyclotransferase (GGCT)/AIG2-like uncharacterized protein YtfP